MSIPYHTQRNLQKFFKILIIAAFAAIFIFGLVSCAKIFEKRDAYVDINLKYGIGSIVTDSTGAGVISDSSTALYSKDAVNCTGFIINTKFDTRVDYEVHFYTADKTYVGYVTTSDVQYIVDVGGMPVLKDYVGNIDSDAYKNATVVTDDAGQSKMASSIRIVIKPMEPDSDIFEGLGGWLNKLKFDDALTLRATSKATSNSAAD